MTDSQETPVARVSRMARGGVAVAGALVSVALVAGAAVWSWKIATRDIYEVPVIRAMAGPMRSEPERPGGQIAAHQGLEVNAVLAGSETAPLPDSVGHAPAEVRLTSEDLPRAALAAEPAAPEAEQLPEPIFNSEDGELAAADEAVTFEVTELSDDLLSQLSPEQRAALDPAVLTDASLAVDAPDIDTPRWARRPRVRPEGLSARALRAEATAPAPLDWVPFDSLETGARLVQLGAFYDPDDARREWTRLLNSHRDLLRDHRPTLGQGTSGGRTIYRLQVTGFASADAVDGFCAAMDARRTPCVPAVVQ